MQNRIAVCVALWTLAAGPARAADRAEVGRALFWSGTATTVAGAALTGAGVATYFSPGKRILTLSPEYERTSWRRGEALLAAGGAATLLGSGTAIFGARFGARATMHLGVAAWTAWGATTVVYALGAGPILGGMGFGLANGLAAGQYVVGRRTLRRVAVLPRVDRSGAGVVVVVGR